ncbi:MAG: 3'-5' exonuclease [Candidatus Omnitrophota bacterium]|nr:3'-5' exonuclease [Candidatus Omnitrophota bacterium]
MRIAECEFSIFDVETTGLFPYHGDKICEIAAIRVDSYCKKARKFSSLVDPKRPISHGAFSINRITGDMLAGKPTIDDILPFFLKFTEGSVLVAYNAGFDLGFLENAMGENKDILKKYFVVDALALARRFFPKAGRYSLGILARHLGIEAPSQHRALADASMTWKVFEKELDIITAEGIEDVKDIAYKRASMDDVISEQKRLTKKGGAV